MSLIDLVQQELGPSGIQNISQQIGADPAATERAISSALPMMVGGMASTAQQAGGESALQSVIGALGGGGNGGGGGLGGMLGGGILGSILGQHHSTVQDGVQQASGLDAGEAGKLLLILAPFIIRALAKHQASPAVQQQDGGIAGSLQKEAQDAAANAGPQVGGILGKILASVTG